MGMTYEEQTALALQRRDKLRELHADLVPGKVYVAVDAGAHTYGVNGSVQTRVVRLEKITPQQLRVSRWVGDDQFNAYPDRLSKDGWVLIEVPDAQTGAAWLADIRKDHDLDGAVEELRRAENEVRKVKARMYRDMLAAIPGYPLGPEVTE